MPGSRLITAKLTQAGRTLAGMARASARRLQVSCKSEEPPGAPATPRHMKRPHVDRQSPFRFQVSACIFSLTCLAAQYVNLFHAVWWLPFSNQTHAINYHLVDRYIALFVCAMLCRRLPCAMMPKLQPKDSALLFFFPTITCCAFQICRSYGLLSLALLLYPVVIYWGVFGPNIGPFLSSTGWTYFPPDHNCCFSAKAPDVRQEAASFKADFNSRLKMVLFDSMLVYYYASFEPCVLMSFHLHVDFHSLCSHGFATWLGAMSMFAGFHFSPEYIDAVHRCSLHLGKWQKIEPRHAPHHMWSDHCFWPQNNLVKIKNKEYFRAEGACNAAEPGNMSHLRLYTLFSHPQQLTRILAILVALQVSTLLWMLITAKYWHNSVVAVLLLLAGSSNLFRTVRQYAFTKQLYATEKAILEAAMFK